MALLRYLNKTLNYGLYLQNYGTLGLGPWLLALAWLERDEAPAACRVLLYSTLARRTAPPSYEGGTGPLAAARLLRILREEGRSARPGQWCRSHTSECVTHRDNCRISLPRN